MSFIVLDYIFTKSVHLVNCVLNFKADATSVNPKILL